MILTPPTGMEIKFSFVDLFFREYPARMLSKIAEGEKLIMAQRHQHTVPINSLLRQSDFKTRKHKAVLLLWRRCCVDNLHACLFR